MPVYVGGCSIERGNIASSNKTSTMDPDLKIQSLKLFLFSVFFQTITGSGVSGVRLGLQMFIIRQSSWPMTSPALPSIWFKKILFRFLSNLKLLSSPRQVADIGRSTLQTHHTRSHQPKKAEGYGTFEDRFKAILEEQDQAPELPKWGLGISHPLERGIWFA